MTAITWVVGSGGLLGQSVVRELLRRGEQVRTTRVPWADPIAARAVLTAQATALIGEAAGAPWRTIWCAGAGVTGTTSQALARETSTLVAVLETLAAAPAGAASNGTVFFSSSAGAVYAGVPNAPHTERSAVAPLAPYGHAKLASEREVLGFGDRTGATVVAARLSNLYGPGQNLAKPQGLISHLCRSFLMAQPVSIYVSLDTIRDYLYVTDAAAMVADTVQLASGREENSIIKIYGAGRSATVGAILAECRAVFKRSPRVVLASSDLANAQSRDLRLRSTVWTELDWRPQTPLAAGISATLAATRQGVFS